MTSSPTSPLNLNSKRTTGSDWTSRQTYCRSTCDATYFGFIVLNKIRRVWKNTHHPTSSCGSLRVCYFEALWCMFTAPTCWRMTKKSRRWCKSSGLYCCDLRRAEEILGRWRSRNLMSRKMFPYSAIIFLINLFNFPGENSNEWGKREKIMYKNGPFLIVSLGGLTNQIWKYAQRRKV